MVVVYLWWTVGWHIDWWRWWGRRQEGKDGKGMREGYKVRGSMCLSVFIPIPTPFPAALSPWAGSGQGASPGPGCPAALSCPWAPWVCASPALVEGPWCSWALLGWPQAAGRTGPESVRPPQALWVRVGLRLAEGPLCPRGHHRSQLAKSWWQGRFIMHHGHWWAEAMLAWAWAGGHCRRCHGLPLALSPCLWQPCDPVLRVCPHSCPGSPQAVPMPQEPCPAVAPGVPAPRISHRSPGHPVGSR